MSPHNPGQAGDGEASRAAPEHVVNMLFAVMPPPTPQPGVEPYSTGHARAAQAQAKVLADQIWAEAWHDGAAWGLARNTQPLRLDLDPDSRAALVEALSKPAAGREPQ